MQRINVHDKVFEKYITEAQIQESVEKVAQAINRDYADKKPVFLSILNGSFMFTSDLLKRIKPACELSFLKLASYQGTSSTGKVKVLVGLNESLEGRDVIIVEDIVDSGHTMVKLIQQVKSHKPASVKVASFLFKPDACKIEVQLDYVGMRIPNDFIVGYGLDYDGLGRNYPDIYTVVKD
jgi:hypoxanthine phosphoribosyltransferase